MMIQRYKFLVVPDSSYPGFVKEDDDGKWCEYEDVAKLEAENEKLKRENGVIKEIRDKLKELFYRSGGEDYIKLLEEYEYWCKQKLVEVELRGR